MDVYYDRVYCIEDGQFVQLCDGEYGAEDNSRVQYDSNGEPIYQYYWNGVQVSSEAEYENLLNQVYDAAQAIDLYEGAVFDWDAGRYTGNGFCTYEEIIEAIEEWGTEGQSQEETALRGTGRENYAMADYLGMTVGDIAEIWGYDYRYMQDWLSGSLKGIYYEDGRIPYTLYFDDDDVMNPSYSPDEKICYVECFAVEEAYPVVGSLLTNVTYEQLMSDWQAEEYYSEIDRYYVVSLTYTDDITISYNYWTNVGTGLADEVTVFDKSLID